MGSAPNASAPTQVSHPAKQGLVQVIVILSKYAIRTLNNDTAQRKAGQEPTFRAEEIDLPHKVDYWQ